MARVYRSPCPGRPSVSYNQILSYAATNLVSSLLARSKDSVYKQCSWWSVRCLMTTGPSKRYSTLPTEGTTGTFHNTVTRARSPTVRDTSRTKPNWLSAKTTPDHRASISTRTLALPSALHLARFHPFGIHSLLTFTTLPSKNNAVPIVTFDRTVNSSAPDAMKTKDNLINALCLLPKKVLNSPKMVLNKSLSSMVIKSPAKML